jgi:hypothetical protein
MLWLDYHALTKCVAVVAVKKPSRVNNTNHPEEDCHLQSQYSRNGDYSCTTNHTRTHTHTSTHRKYTITIACSVLDHNIYIKQDIYNRRYLFIKN